MPNLIALLRGINVGGNNLISMSDLKEHLATLGFDNPRTLLQSGNVVFSHSARKSADLEKTLAMETEKRFKAAVDYFVRSPKEWEEMIDHNPFPKEAVADPGHLVVVVLKKTPEPAAFKALQEAIVGPEVIQIWQDYLYAYYPAGMGKSKLTNAVIERKLGTRGTARNWNTVLKIASIVK